MNYIENIFNSVCKEIKYQYFSKMMIITLIIILGLSIWNLYSQGEQVKSNYKLYLHTKSDYQKEGIDINKALHTKSTIKEQNSLNGDNIEIVDNILKYDYDNLAISIDIMRPEHTISQTLEWLSFLFFPFVFFIYGLIVATYDIKYKTIKIKAIQNDWSKILFTKQISLYISVMFIILFTLLFSYLFELYFFRNVSQIIPISEFPLTTPIKYKNVYTQIIFSICISSIYITLGFYFGTLLRSFFIPTVLFTAYNFILPIFGKYDLRNLIAILGHKYFLFHGNFSLFKPIQIPLKNVNIILTTSLVIITMIFYLFSKKQSKYII